METNEILGLLIFVAFGISMILCKCSLEYTRNKKLLAFTWTFFSFSVSSFFGIFLVRPLFWFVFVGIVFFILTSFTIFKSYSKRRHKGDRKKYQTFFLYAVLMLCALIVERSLIGATLQHPFVFYVFIAINIFVILVALKKSLKYKVNAKEEHYVLLISAMILVGLLMVINVYLSFLYTNEIYTLIPVLVTCILAIASSVYQVKEVKITRLEILQVTYYDQKEYLFKEVAYSKRWIMKVLIGLFLIMVMAYSFL